MNFQKTSYFKSRTEKQYKIKYIFWLKVVQIVNNFPIKGDFPIELKIYWRFLKLKIKMYVTVTGDINSYV